MDTVGKASKATDGLLDRLADERRWHRDKLDYLSTVLAVLAHSAPPDLKAALEHLIRELR